MSNHKKERNNIAIILREKFKSSFVSKITSVEFIYFLLGSFTFDKFITLYQIREVLTSGIIAAVVINIVLSLYVLWRFRKILERHQSVQRKIKKYFLFYTIPVLLLHVFNTWAMIQLSWFLFYRMLRYGY